MSDPERAFSIDDVAIEILSRLSVKELSAGKCISKRWNDIISSPLFLHVHSKRSAAISGLLFHLYKLIDDRQYLDRPFPDHTYLSFDIGDMFHKTFLDFLPEGVELMGSSNGLVCCRSSIIAQNAVICPEELVIYVCNPSSRKWTSLRPKRCDIGIGIGIAFFPFGLSQNTFPVYKLVSIQKSETKPTHYSFTVYSSETNYVEKI